MFVGWYGWYRRVVFSARVWRRDGLRKTLRRDGLRKTRKRSTFDFVGVKVTKEVFTVENMIDDMLEERVTVLHDM